jgi:hypothetical protein
MAGSPECNKPNQEWRASPQSQRESEGNALAPLLREQRGGGERSHEEIVASIRKDMAAYLARKGPIYQFDPVAWMREHFIHTRTNLMLSENPNLDPNVDRQHRPHAQLLMAWDLISQPYYKSAYHRGLAELGVKDDARHLGHTITLDPNEAKLLSAMAEAVGIPNPFGPMTPEKPAPK